MPIFSELFDGERCCHIVRHAKVNLASYQLAWLNLAQPGMCSQYLFGHCHAPSHRTPLASEFCELWMRFDLLATNFNAQSVMRNSVNCTQTPKHFSLLGAHSRLILRLKEVTSQVANCVSDLSQQPDGLESHDAQQEPTSKPHCPISFASLRHILAVRQNSIGRFVIKAGKMFSV